MCKTSKIDWNKPLKFHNNSDFVVEVVGDSLTRAVTVKMYHPKLPDTIYFSIFDRDTGLCIERGRDGEYDCITNREEYKWCVSYCFEYSYNIAKYGTEEIANRSRARMLQDPNYSDISPVWKQVKK